MQYFIKRDNPLSQFIQLDLHLFCQAGETVELQLPAWRPGRYELTNYAQKVRKLKAEFNKDKLIVHKLTKDLWTFTAKEEGSHHITYEFHASQMDAGGSWSDDEQLYLNFINFIFEVKGRPEERIAVEIVLPSEFKVATALPPSGPNQFIAENFQHLVDSPLFASPSLAHYTYTHGDTVFHLWFQGEVHFDIDDLKGVFQNFTLKQIEAFGDFPATDYHFLIQLLPYKHYHGVEHRYSTVITIGPAEKLIDKEFLEKLIGVSSHELYHFWNVCRIRPEELLPYDFSKEAYIETGVVAEGVTTYMGDLFLLKSGYYTLEQYLKVLENLLDREFENFGWQTQSIVDSSLDLWLDGYKAGIPDKKVSIYNRGAIISLCLDLILLDHGSSLQQVMKEMYSAFGNSHIGYSLYDYKTALSGFLNDPAIMDDFFQKFIYGTADIRILLEQQLNSIGVRLEVVKRDIYLEGDLGIISDETGRITKIHPDSPAIRIIMIGDEIKEFDGMKFSKNLASVKQEVEMKIIRYGRSLELNIPLSTPPLYMNYKLELTESNIKTEKWIS